MRFGPVAVTDAVGCVLAHSVQLADYRLRKGKVLSRDDVAALLAAKITEITVAQLGPADWPENEAAQIICRAVQGMGLRVSAPFAGRVNIFAIKAGLMEIDRSAVDALNAIDPSITLATVPEWTSVQARQMVATLKIIPYAAPKAAVAAATGPMTKALKLHAYKAPPADLILTNVPGQKPSLNTKAEAIIRARLAALGGQLHSVSSIAHDQSALQQALAGAAASWVLILTGSATSDIDDLAPAALKAAGGQVERFGMPVDPGNLLFLGRKGQQTVVGLPGCARSIALNGADFVLQRLAAGLPVDDAVIRGMGVGGLLKEIPTRPQARAAQAVVKQPRVAVVMLAAGASRRMQGVDKLLEPVGGAPLLRHVTQVAMQSDADRVCVVLPHAQHPRAAALAGLDVDTVLSANHAEGMAGSLRDGIAALPEGCDAVIVALADMPEVTSHYYNTLIAAFDAQDGREICRAVSADGQPGHPVLFSRRFFESLSALQGDSGARAVLAAAPEFVVDVPMPGQGAVVDLDTPQAWDEWRNVNRH